MYKNLQNNTIILDEDVLSIEDGVITFFDGSNWTSIPTSDIQEIESKAEDEANDNKSIANVYSFEPDVSIKAGLYIPNSVSYYKTSKISITPSNYVQLQAEYSDCDSGSIEFYIIDNEKNNLSLYDAIAIRPINSAYINKERCWFNRGFRFTQDENDTALFYVDDILDTNIKSLSDIDFSDGRAYTVSYKPKDFAGTSYSPKNSYISLLIILRSYDKTKKPPYVKNIKIIESRRD